MATVRPGVFPAVAAAVLTALLAAGSTAQAQGTMLTGFSQRRAAEQLELEARFLELPSSDAFHRHLERLTRDPHPLGSDANAAVADYLAEAMDEAGLQVERYAYDVYAPLLYPDMDVALVRPIRLPLNNQEYVLDADPFSAHPDAQPGWNAFSGSGDVTGEVVYVNYGTREDFQQLADLGVSLEGRIALARYGANFQRFCDPEFVYGPAMARVDGILALRLANAEVLPYDVARYAADLERHLTDLERAAADREMEMDLGDLRAAIASLAAAAGRIDAARVAYLAAGDRARLPLAELNAGLIALERAFIHRDGLQDRPWSRSLYASPDPYSGYAAWMLPGLRYEVVNGRAEGVRQWQEIYVGAVGKLTRRIEQVLAALGT